MANRQWSSTAPPAEFKPYVEAEESVAEFSLRAVILGSLFGILFGAVSVYVGLRAGLTVSASIPIAVLSISILRAFGRSTILENNIVQTTGSAGESVAAGVIFSIPALIFLGFSLNSEYWRIFFLALMGGWLGVFFMIPLRRQLIVKEHGNLTFPEGTACADVLVAGERGGSFAGRVFWGLGLGGVLRQARPLAREPYELQLLAELRDPCVLDRHATILSSSSYTESGCCKLSIGVATRRAIIGGAFRAGAGSMTARSSGRSFIGATPVVPWMRTFATSSSHRRTWRLATSTSSRRPLASRLEASGSTKLPFRYELKRSTFPFVFGR